MSVSELPLCVGQIIPFDWGCLYLNSTLGANLWILDCKIWHQNTRNITPGWPQTWKSFNTRGFIRTWKTHGIIREKL